MVLSLKYSNLSSTISESNKLANELGQYCDALSKKVQQKMYSVEGGMSSALNNADYYVSAKIKGLRTREKNARNLSAKTQNLIDTAKRVDANVKSTIEANQKSFFKKNPDMKPSKVKLALSSFYCDMKNVPVLGWVIKGGEEAFGALDQLAKDIKHWYKCGGGEQLLTNLCDIVVKIGEAILAVITVVTLIITGAGILAIIGAAILAVIAVMNAGTNIATSIQAIQAGKDDPAMSKIYSNRDSLKQVLQETNFKDREKNRFSNAAASFITGLEVLANILRITDGLKCLADKWDWTKLKQSFNWLFRNKDFGNFKLNFIKGDLTLWNGVKTIGVKIYQNIPQIAKDGFKIDSVIKVLKDWRWVKDPIEVFDGLKEMTDLLPTINAEYESYQKDKVFYNISDQIAKLSTLGNAGQSKPIVILPKNLYVMPKFESLHPYFNVAA